MSQLAATVSPPSLSFKKKVRDGFSYYLDWISSRCWGYRLDWEMKQKWNKAVRIHLSSVAKITKCSSHTNLRNVAQLERFYLCKTFRGLNAS